MVMVVGGLRAASGSRAGDLSTESSGCQRALGPEAVPLHSYPRRGITGKLLESGLVRILGLFKTAAEQKRGRLNPQSLF